MAGGSSPPSIISGRNPIEYTTSSPLTLFIIQILIIICITRCLHLIFKRINQPTVISEILGGIMLGPTVLGRWTAFRSHVFPTASMVNLNLVANFGLVLFLFMVGLELDPKILKRNLHRSLAISVAGMVLPFGLGVATSYALFHMIEKEGSFVNFMLFCGVAMAITAFPVLARILTEQNLLKTTVGSISISAAAIDDVVSWCLLALVIALTNNGSGLSALWVFLVGAGWTLFVLFVVRPVYTWYLRRNGCLQGREPSQMVLFVTFFLVLVSAYFTDIIGIHAIFGGFIIGVIVPHDGGFAIRVTEKIEDMVQIFFLPIYFALSGLNTNLSDLNDGKTWGLLILICFVAFFGKIVGCTLAAKWSKFSWRESLTIGFLMNCKGLVELIVLNIGLQAGVINTRIFTMMVVKALVTTFVTTPAVMWLYPPQFQERIEDPHAKKQDDDDAATQHGPEAGTPMNLLVVLSRLQQVPSLMTLLGYLHNQPELSGSRKVTEDGTKMTVRSVATHLYRPIRVFALRLQELTGRNSSVMHQYESESRVVTDPVMSVFRAFARVANLVFHASLSHSDQEHFVDSVLGSARDADAELTIVSAFGRGTSGAQDAAAQESMSAAMTPGWFSSMGWGFTSAQQAAFITTLFSKAPGHVGVFIDCGLSDGSEHAAEPNVPRPLYFTDGKRVPRVIVPFFGGADDRLAVQMVCDLCTHAAVQVVVWRFVRAEKPTDQDVVLREDQFPARPVIPATPAAVAQTKGGLKGEVDPWAQSLRDASLDKVSLELAATKVDDTVVSDAKREDGIFLDIALKPHTILPSPPAPLIDESPDTSAQADHGLRKKITQKLRFRSPTATTPAAVVGDTVEERSMGVIATQYPNMLLEVIETATPLQTMLLRARGLERHDLIVCGRSVRSSLPYYSHQLELDAYKPAGHRHTKPERQRALGTVPEYLLGFGTSASMLVLQSSSTTPAKTV
ncbi:K(+)/H(+) antiporter [Linderina macrospora]|uniref:K(+)/H(+) antiporter n=1 Tax=Linderina macrospora TaxID=4868 RepID=A0ACC1JHM3_9FUNG|nr:K(+)/H(+) antiporter [Linderina macrospora]